MLWVPQKGVLRVQTNDLSVGDYNTGTAVTPNATSSLKGSPTELIASTGFDVFLVLIGISKVASTAATRRCCVDIMAGAATEDVLIPDLLGGGAGSQASFQSAHKQWLFPVYIPAGTRLSARAASEGGATTIFVSLKLFGGNGIPPFQVGSSVTSYGIGGTLPQATAITFGASGAEGSWTQIVASTTRDHFCTVPSVQLGSDATVSMNKLSVDVGIGSATEEQIGPPYVYATTTSESMSGPYPNIPVFSPIPSGSRLVMRGSASGLVDAYEGALHCVS